MESIFWSSLGMTTIAGMTTMLGGLIIFVVKGRNEKLLAISLGLAAGVMISVSFHDLFPHSEQYFYAAMGNKFSMLPTVGFLGLGVIIAALLDRLVPHSGETKGMGHEHADLFRVGFVSMLGIALHNLPEGMATFMANFYGMDIGLSVTMAIALHNIPEGIAVAMPMYVATGSKKRALLYALFCSITEPLGALLGYVLMRAVLNEYVMGAVFGLTAGIMLYIAIEELLPSSRQYGYRRQVLIATFIGMVMIPLVHLIG